MAINVIMPKWGLTMKDAKIVKWLKEEGESVQKDEPLATVMTEKITSEVTAPEAGVLARIIAPVGTIVPVTGVIAIIADPGEEIPEGIAALPTVEQAPEVGSAPPQKVRAAAEEGEVPPVLASPLARRLAREHSVDLAQVTGTGPRGRVTEKDILAFVDAREKAPLPATAAPTRVVPFAGMRQMIAENMTQSLQTMAQVTLHTEVDATELVKLRGQLKTEFDLTYTDLLIRATVKALKSHPDLNATLVGDEIHLLEEIHIGMAVALKDGLLVPVVQNADAKSLAEIAQDTRRLAQGAREGTLTVDEVTGSTFTITNLGAYGVDGFTPIINPPEVAILGVGRIVERPAIHEGQITRRSIMTLSLTIDHRIVDGAPGADFLRTMREILESPYRLLV